MEAQIERPGAIAAADLQQVTEALCCEQRRLGADALKQRVDDERGAVLDEAPRASIFALRIQSKIASPNRS
jgi:hypothetical protein